MLLAPLFMAVLVICCSPNFYSTGELRTQPLGGDLLQEWSAGHVLRSSEASKLYDVNHFRSVQHDTILTGFRWQESGYFPAVYPPFYYLAMTPLSFLDYPAAIRVWAILSALFLIAAFEALLRFQPAMWGTDQISPAACVGFFVLFTPVWLNFTMGQKSALILLLFVGTYLLLKNNRHFAAGVVFGLLAFKPHLALVVGLAFLLRRNWAFVTGGATTVSCLGLLSMSLGWDLNQAFLVTTLGATDYVQTGGYQPSEAHNIWGVAALMFGSESLATSIATWALTVAVAATVALLSLPSFGNRIFRWANADSRNGAELLEPGEDSEIESVQFDLQFAVLVFGTILLSPHFYTYDLVLVLLPILLCYRAANSAVIRSERQALLKGLLITYLLFAGLFSQVATSVRLQPSLMITVLILTILVANRWVQPKPVNDGGVSRGSWEAT